MRSPERTKAKPTLRNATKKRSTKDDERQYLRCVYKGPQDKTKKKRKNRYALPRLLIP